MSENEVRNLIKKMLVKSGSQTSLAKNLGVSPQYLGDVLKGRRSPAGKMLGSLGIERVTSYRKIQ